MLALTQTAYYLPIFQTLFLTLLGMLSFLALVAVLYVLYLFR